MINRYKKTITSILDKLHNARKKPFEKIEKWLIIQEILIKKIIYVENRIRKQKQEIKSLNKYRKDSEKRINKRESYEVKKLIKYKKYQIKEYKKILGVYNSLGDGIAFTFLDKHVIKPQNFKELPGFISRKKGITKEKKILRYLFSIGRIAILNDITSVLRYADITLIGGHRTFTALEIKTSNNLSSRMLGQQKKEKKLYKYLKNDVVEGLYSNGRVMHRVATEIPEINYIEQINDLIEKAEKSGIAYSLMEKDLLYVVFYNEFPKVKLDNILSKHKLKKPYVLYSNMFKFTGQGYYPFSLSLRTTKHYWDFLVDKLNILIFLDLENIDLISKDSGFNFQQSQDKYFPFTFNNVRENNFLDGIKVSIHMFGRIFMEFISAEWLIKETLNTEKLKNYFK